MGCIMPTLMNRSSQIFGKYGFVSRWSILLPAAPFLAGALVAYAWYLFVHLRASRPQTFPASAAKASPKPS
jgi:hypothetical protein